MILVANQHPVLRFSRQETRRTLLSVLRKEAIGRLSLSVVFVDNRFMRKINWKFLHHNYNTDVVAFPLRDGIGVDGELYINLDKAQTQAKAYGVRFKDETRRLLVHGTLHLLGYDDSTKESQRKMRTREDFYLERFQRTEK